MSAGGKLKPRPVSETEYGGRSCLAKHPASSSPRVLFEEMWKGQDLRRQEPEQKEVWPSVSLVYGLSQLELCHPLKPVRTWACEPL
jgi:hypothetical protein